VATSTVNDQDRAALRRTFRRLRRALSPEQQRHHSVAAARHFFAAGLAWRASTVGLYIANDGELDLEPLAARLRAAGKRVALPVIRSTPGRLPLLEFYRWDAQARLQRNRYGIPEPAPGAAFVPALGLDLLLVPLVAFDRHGTRLGMGAGYYDRFLGALAPGLRPPIVGVAHEVQRSPTELPAAPWDVPLDGILTERGWQRLRG
jgi:5-formyltetrahydrofolate cyclo-ligase